VKAWKFVLLAFTVLAPNSTLQLYHQPLIVINATR